MQLDLGKAMHLGRLVPGASRPTHEQRFNRAMQDLDALEHGEQEHTGIVWLYNWLKDKFDLAILWCVDMYTGASFWLHSKYPRGYLLLFFGLSMFGSAIYIYDIYTDFVVATILLDNGLVTEAGVVLVFILFHYVVISFMLGVKFYYHFEAKVINTIDRLTFPWDPKSHYSIHDTVQQQEVDAFLKSLTSSTVQLSSRPPQNATMVETTQNTLLLGLSRVVRGVLKSVTFLVYCLALVAVTPFLDIAMMCLELLGGSVVVHAKSSITKNVLAFQNFLLQYETLRVPSRSYLESLPQTAYQGYLYATLKDDNSLNLDMGTLAQSIAISIFSAAKSTIEIWIAYKVSGFSFWSYVNNAILFEGAATLPFRWNAKRSSMLDRLVLGGDFYTLAHAQKMKLFQAALQHRKSITITTEEAKALGEECVVVASSLTMLEFIANMLPVSLSEQHASSAAIHIDITDIKNLPWRDDGRTISRERALKVLFNMHESLMAFVNVPMIWQKLEVVRMVNCNLPDLEEEVDYGGLGELLLRSRIKVLEMTHTKIRDHGLRALVFGLVENCSLVHLGLAGTGITANGARQLLQGLKGHDTLAELDVSLNHLKSDGAQHLARLIVTLPSLQQLHVAAIGMRADGLQALSMQASYAPRLRVLNMSANPDAFATPEAMDLLVTLLMRAPHGLHLHVGHCKLDSACVEALCRGGMVGKRGLRGLGLSGNAISRQGIESFCEALWSRVQRDRYALGLPELPPYVPYQLRVHALQDEAAAFHQQRRLERLKTDVRLHGSLTMQYSHPSHGLGPVPSEIKPGQTSSSGRTGSILGTPGRWKRLLSLTNMDSNEHEQDVGKDKGGAFIDNARDSNDYKEGNAQEYPLLAEPGNKGPRHNRSKSVTFALMAEKINEFGSKLKHISAQPEGQVSALREGSESSNPETSLAARSSGHTRQVSLLGLHHSVREENEGAGDEGDAGQGLLPEPTKLQRTYVVLLELCGCGLRKDDVDELCHVLFEAPGLAVLDLSHNSELGNDALGACARLIGGPQQSTMTKLRMVNCGLSASGLYMQGVSFALSSLTEVDLSCNPLGDEGVNELCLDVLAVPFNKLQVLGLASVNMGKQGFNYLLEALANDSCLQRLNLSNNFIGGFQTHLYELFQSKNKTLKLMDLRHNQLSYEWCMVLQQIAEMGLRCIMQLWQTCTH